MDRQISVTQPYGTTGSTSTTAYNADSSVASQTDPAGIVTTFNYDASSRLLSKTEATALPQQRTTSYKYDSMNRVIQVSYSDGTSTFSLKWWCARAGRSKLEPVCKLSKTVRNHWDGIIGYFESGLTNAAIEAVNGNIQLAKRLARGFRNFKYFQAMGYLKAARLNIILPTPLPTLSLDTKL